MGRRQRRPDSRPDERADQIRRLPAREIDEVRLTHRLRRGWVVRGGPIPDEDRLDLGFNLNAGAGINFTPQFGIIGEFGFNNLGLSDIALAAANVPGGSTRVYSLTANPIFRFNPRGRFDVYAIGGGGWYRRTVEFTEPAG